MAAFSARTQTIDGVIEIVLVCCCCWWQLKHHNAAIQEKELALKLAAQRQEFLQHLSHEMRTPLNVCRRLRLASQPASQRAVLWTLHFALCTAQGMFGATQLLMMSGIDDSQRANLNIIASSIGQLRDVLTSVLDLAKMNNGAMELEQLPFDLPSALQQVACQFVVARARVCVCLPACLPAMIDCLID